MYRNFYVLFYQKSSKALFFNHLKNYILSYSATMLSGLNFSGYLGVIVR